MRIDIRAVYDDVDHRMLPVRVEGDIVQQILHNRMQTACADILVLFVCPEREFCDFAQSVLGKAEVHVVRLQKRGILLGHRVLRLRQDRVEVVLGEVL